MYPSLFVWRVCRDHVHPLLIAFADYQPLDHFAFCQIEPVTYLRLIFLKEAHGGDASPYRPVFLPPSLFD